MINVTFYITCFCPIPTTIATTPARLDSLSQPAMVLTVILRGFKVPVTLLDRFLEANNQYATYGHPPLSAEGQLDAESAFLRTKLARAGHNDTKARLFIPQKEGHARAAHAYVAYACVLVHAQRKLDLARELPDTAPPGFAELCREILGFVRPGEEALLCGEGLQDAEGEDLAAALYVVVADERVFWSSSPCIREVSSQNRLRGCCRDCVTCGPILIPVRP